MNPVTDLSQFGCSPFRPAWIPHAGNNDLWNETMSLKTITRSKSFQALESAVASHHGEVDLFNELETIAIDAPRGRQWIDTGTATVQRSRSNGVHSYTREACIELIDIAKQGTEPASQDTIEAMGW